MRLAPILLLAVGMAAKASGPLTIVLDFQGPRSEQSISEMKREFHAIMRGSGLTFNWRLREDSIGESFANLVVVRFKGKCRFEPVAHLYDERGLLAFTYTADGVPQPFSEVACDQVTATMRSAMWGGDYGKADLLMGRALARVIAHEIVHILASSGEHGREGIAKATISGAQLIAQRLRLAPADLKRLHRLQ